MFEKEKESKEEDELKSKNDDVAPDVDNACPGNIYLIKTSKVLGI